jgi:hypothetical protein
MRTPPREPFLSLPPELVLAGGALDDPAEAVRRFAGALAGTARVARALIETGERIDLTGLTAQVGLLCAKALDLAPEQGQQVRVELITLRSDFDLLAHALGQPPLDS